MHIIISPSVHNFSVTKNKLNVEFQRRGHMAFKSRASEFWFFIEVEENPVFGVQLNAEGWQL